MSLFGKQAQAYKPFINQLSNTIIEEFHPAYYARTNLKMSNQLFKQIDKELFDKYKISINWYYYSKKLKNYDKKKLSLNIIDSKEVSEGDFVKVGISKIKLDLTPSNVYSFSHYERAQHIDVYKVNKKLLESLSALNVLEKVYTIVYEEVPSFQEYINKALKIFAANVEIPNYIVFELCAKAIAIDIDKTYPNHISESPRIYGINKLNGEIKTVNKEKIKKL